jgi:hypothetical protein
MTEMLEFFKADVFMFVILTILVGCGLVSLAATLASGVFAHLAHRTRHKTLLAHGYPPVHCDVDGMPVWADTEPNDA